MKDSYEKNGHMNQVEALQGQVSDLTRKLIQRDLDDMKRKQAEEEAKRPKPESMELRSAKSMFEREFQNFHEDYRQAAWSEKFNYGNVTPFPLAAGWPDKVDPVKFVRRKCGLNDDGTALAGSEPEPTETKSLPSFMDKWRT